MRFSPVFRDRRPWSRFHSAAVFALLLAPAAARAATFYAYVGDLGPTYATLAWGTTDGENSIGRSSPSHGAAVVTVAGVRVPVAGRNWVTVQNLNPDTTYPYEVTLGGTHVAAGRFRTWAAEADSACFYVIGDMGNGNADQYRVAAAMTEDFKRSESSACPVRFVLTVGDNVYGNRTVIGGVRTGASDADWGPKFFEPYKQMLASVPFYPSLGNHDGNETEARADLGAYLDNFFFPGGRPSRYYRFNYGGLADFFALDSTQNTAAGGPYPAYVPESDQVKWLAAALRNSSAAWKIPYFHHPVFSAGPHHGTSLDELRPFFDLFAASGVRLVFSGHEHNFQISEASPRTRGIRFIVTGAAGQLRGGDVRAHMDPNGIAAWAGQLHWTWVKLTRSEAMVQPMSFEPLHVADSRNRPFPLPLRVERRPQ